MSKIFGTFFAAAWCFLVAVFLSAIYLGILCRGPIKRQDTVFDDGITTYRLRCIDTVCYCADINTGNNVPTGYCLKILEGALTW